MSVFLLKSNSLILRENHNHLDISFEAENLFYNYIILKYILRHRFSNYDYFRGESIKISAT